MDRRCAVDGRGREDALLDSRAAGLRRTARALRHAGLRHRTAQSELTRRANSSVDVAARRRGLPSAVTAVALALCIVGGVFAQAPAGRPRATRATGLDEDYTSLVKQWTTRSEFLSPLVDHLPKSASVPSPRDVLGHHIGAPQQLTYTRDQQRYFRALEEATRRLKTVTIGKTEEGREILAAFVSSEENIRNLETNRQNVRRLADPRGLTPAAARDLIARTKPHYHITAGLHS